MGKKDFKTGIDFLIQESKDNLNEENNSRDNDLEVSEQKATYMFNTERLLDIKAIAYYERKTIGEVLDEALLIYLKQNPMLEKAKLLYGKKQQNSYEPYRKY